VPKGAAAIPSGATDPPRVPEAGCRALATLSEDSPLVRHVISEKGGVEAVLRAMSRYPGEAKVQDAGCTVLANLAEGANEDRELTSSRGGVQAVVLAMVDHPQVRPAGLRFLVRMDRSELDAARNVLCKEKGAARMEGPLEEIRLEVEEAGGVRRPCSLPCGWSPLRFCC